MYLRQNCHFGRDKAAVYLTCCLDITIRKSTDPERLRQKPQSTIQPIIVSCTRTAPASRRWV